MRKYLIIIPLLTIISSCGSGLYKSTTVFNNISDELIKSYDFDDFDIYVYSICEDSKSEVNNERFYNCPDNFFKLNKTDTILKVEEVYLMKHRPTDLVLYLTTTSDKYIRHKKGFLNDRSIYENTIVLNKMEYAYIGSIDKALNLIYFPNQKKGEDLILHYNTDNFPDQIQICEANIAAAENTYSTAEKIDIENIFRQPLNYDLKDYQLHYYGKEIGGLELYKPDSVNVLIRNGKMEVVFGNKATDSLFFRISNKKIRYNTNFSMLPQ